DSNLRSFNSDIALKVLEKLNFKKSGQTLFVFLSSDRKNIKYHIDSFVQPRANTQAVLRTS
ncbi:MAG: hypothetical protein LBF22_03295, partial [Deltaproteobacteria bacterium]|nr:hypothetical protein [Deltaproteobacteria bacterium]